MVLCYCLLAKSRKFHHAYDPRRKKPCLTHGLRGISYFKLSISGPGADLHSGIFGGVVHEPMTDLFHIMSSLVTPQGEILVPGIKELVDPLTEEERKRYEVMEFGVKDMNDATGSATTISDEKEGILMARMRYPSLSLHGVEVCVVERTPVSCITNARTCSSRAPSTRQVQRPSFPLKSLANSVSGSCPT